MEAERKDKLDRMFEAQEQLQEDLGYSVSTMSDEEVAAYIKEYAEHMIVELGEMLKEMPYFKPWKKYPDPDWTKAQEEFADVVHFMLNVALGLGYTPYMLYQAYMDKNNANHERQDNTDEYKRCVE